MNFVVIFGPPAVGKMTVAFELAEHTGLRVFHNHMTVDLLLNYFEFGDEQYRKLVREFRRRIFEEVAVSSLPGIIFTYVWALDHASDREFIDECCEIFRRRHGEVYFVELEASQEERLRRNRTKLRLEHKPTKRDRVKSERHLLEADKDYKLNSNGDFFYQDNYMKIENTDLSAADVAEKIVSEFGFEHAASAGHLSR